MKTKHMPKIDLAKLEAILTSDEFEIARRIVNTRTGELRASKPEIEYTIRGNFRYPGYVTGCAAYVWRMVAFSISPKDQHHCMPVCADFDLPMGEDYEERRNLAKLMDDLADRIINTVPKSEWHGITRWAQAYGLTGTPQYNEEGAVVYR